MADWHIRGWDDIGRNMEGSLLHRLAETGKALGGLVTGPVGLIYDVSRMVNGYDGEWNDIKKDLGATAGAFAAPFSLALDPLTPVFETLYKPYKYGVSPALSTLGLGVQAINPMVDGPGDDISWDLTDWEQVKAIYGTARRTSPGNAIVPALHGTGLDASIGVPFQIPIYTTDWAALFDGDYKKFAWSLTNAYRPWTKEDLEMVDNLNGGVTWNVITGLTDAAATWFLDPTVIAGKGIKVYRAKKYAKDVPGILKSKNVRDILERQTGAKPTEEMLSNPGTILELPAAERMITWADDQIARDPIRAERTFTELFGGRRNHQSRVLSALLVDAGRSNGRNGIEEVLRVAVGDQRAITDLRVNRASTMHALETAEDKVSSLREVLNNHAVTGGFSSQDHNVLRSAQGLGSGTLIQGNQVRVDRVRAFVDHLEERVIPDARTRDNYLDRLVGDINRAADDVADLTPGVEGALYERLPFSAAAAGRGTGRQRHLERAGEKARKGEWDPRVSVIDRAWGVRGPRVDAPASINVPFIDTITYYPKGILGVPVRAYRVASRAMTDYRPNGWADLNDAANAAEETYRMLTRVKGVRPTDVQRYVGAISRARGEGAITAAVREAEEFGIRTAAVRYGIDPDMARNFANGVMAQRDSAWTDFISASKQFGVLEGKNKKVVHRIAEEDGIPENVPYLLKQLENRMPLLDMDIVQKDFARRNAPFRAMAGKMLDGGTSFADWGLRAWRFNVLIRGIGFPVKVLADDGARYWSVLDTLSASPNRKLWKEVFSSGAVRGAGMLPKNTMDFWRGQPMHWSEVREWMRTKNNKTPYERTYRSRSGEGTYSYRGMDFEDLFGGLDSDLLRRMVSGQWWAMDERQRSVHNILRMGSGGRRVSAADDEIGQLYAWRDNINYQLGSDPIIQRLLKGDSPEKVTAWYRKQRNLRKRNEFLGRNPEATVARAKALLDQYVPPNMIDVPPPNPLAGEGMQRYGELLEEVRSAASNLSSKKGSLTKAVKRYIDEAHPFIEGQFPRRNQAIFSPPRYKTVNKKTGETRSLSAFDQKFKRLGADAKKELERARAALSSKVSASTDLRAQQDELDDFVKKFEEYQLAVERIKANRLSPGLYEAGATLRDKMLRKEVDIEDLRRIPIENRPDVHDIDFSLNLVGGNLSQQISGIMGRVYNTVINVPHSAMVRHPLALQLYQHRVRQLTDIAMNGGGPLTYQDIGRIQQSARRYSLHQVGQIVMDLSAESSAGHAVRFIMPFFDAWRESLVKWTKLMYDDPTRLYRIMEYRNSWGSAFELQDSEGNKLDIQNPKGVPVEDQKFVLRLPDSLAKKIPGLEEMSQVEIPRGATDFVFQGQRWFEPDFGPFVKVPASQLLQNKPDLEQAFKVLGIMPDGAVDPQSLVFGSTYRNFYKTIAGPEGDRAFMQSMLYIALADHQKYLDGKRTNEVNWEEVKTKTKILWATKTMAGLFSPVSTQFKPKTQPLIDEYRRLLADDSVGPENADRVFYEKNPEMFIWAATLSKNNAHLPASKLAMKRTRQFGDLISKHPDMAAVIVGNVEGQNDFSPSVYQWQMNNLMGSGTGKTFRQFQSARDAFAAVQMREGWVKFQKMVDGLSATLNSRGLVDFSDTGAEDLALLKRQFIDTLAGENPVWGEDYFTANRRRVPDWIEAAKDIVRDPRIMRDPNRQDIQGLSQYIQIRDSFLAILKERKRRGGSADITAQSNADLYQSWRMNVGQLKESNTQFSTLAQRYLELDSLQEATWTDEGPETNDLLGVA